MSQPYQPFSDLWVGVAAVDFTLARVRRFAAFLAPSLLSRNQSCLVAADTRFMSGLFAQEIFAILQRAGVAVRIASGPVPLPAVQFALDRKVADSAVVVSARNLPYWYNGLVLLNPAGALRLEERDYLPPPDAGFPANPNLPLPPEALVDLRAPYLDHLRSQVDLDPIRRNSITFFVDSMSGTTAGCMPTLIAESGQTRAIEINKESDPLFSRTMPLPVEAPLTRLRKLVRESDSHLGLALSADGTALGLCEKGGEPVDLCETTLLLGSYLARQYRYRGAIIAPPPSPLTPLAAIASRAAHWEDTLGLKVEISSDSAARIAEVIQTERSGLLVGATADGEIVIGRNGPVPDALSAGLMLVEMTARNGGNLRSQIETLREQLLKG